MAPSRIADSSAGNANVKSARRITNSSTQPPRADASRPSPAPIEKPISTANTPTRIDARAPTSSCDAMSRPRLSVPNQCAALAPCNLCGMSISAGGYGEHNSESAAAPSNSSVSTAPIAKLGWRHARTKKPGATGGEVNTALTAGLRSRVTRLEAGVDHRVQHVDHEV